MTTATFDDWVLGCQRAGPADKPVRVCEVGQTVRAQGRQEAVARVAIGRLSKSDPLRFATLLPPNVSFPSSVRVALNDSDPLALDLPWRRCLTGFCQADGELGEAVLKAWRGTADAGQITFKDATGRSVTVPLSFKGLAPALDALAKEIP